jgi:photosystem II stability/assembly factor-like uncharacterized protein
MPCVGQTAFRTTRRRALALAAVVLLGTGAAAEAVAIRDNLYGVSAVSGTEAWAVGNFGSIYHTTDAGKTWESQQSGTKLPLFDVDFSDAVHGWAAGKASIIVHTADGGRTWTRQKSVIPADKHLFNVEAIDASTAWVVGDWGAMTVTEDGGNTWQDRSLAEDVIVYDVSFPDPRHGFVVGEFGTLLATGDGGRTWEKRDVGTEKTLFGVTFSTPEKGWVVGIDGLLLRTRDGGQSWEVQRGSAHQESLEELGFLETIKNPGLYDIEIVGQQGVVVGDTGTVLSSTDGGETWTRSELPERQRLVWLRSISLVPDARGFAVGAAGFSAAIERGRLLLPPSNPTAIP